MEPLTLRQRLIKSIKWIVLFAIVLAWFKPGPGEEQPGTALGVLVGIPLYIAIYRILYGRVEDLFDGIGYLFTPDLLSLLFGELLRDWHKSARVGVLLVCCFFAATSINSHYSRAYQSANPDLVETK